MADSVSQAGGKNTAEARLRLLDSNFLYGLAAQGPFFQLFTFLDYHNQGAVNLFRFGIADRIEINTGDAQVDVRRINNLTFFINQGEEAIGAVGHIANFAQRKTIGHTR